MPQTIPLAPVAAAVRACRRHLVAAALFSATVNLLYLTPTIFMLQVYDRVVPTGDALTLLFIALAALMGFALLAMLDVLRTRLLVKTGARLEANLAGPALEAVMTRANLSRVERNEALADLTRLREMLSGPAVVAACDAPWTPIYLIAATAIHPLLGLFTLVAGAILLALAWTTERRTARALAEAGAAAGIAQARQAHVTAYAAEARAMGMVPGLSAALMADRTATVERQTRASLGSAGYGGFTKFIRMVSQSGALALAAWLAVDGSISAGAIFAASLLLGRALAPLELLIGAWKGILRGATAYGRLKALLPAADASEPVRLPECEGRYDLEALTVATPQGRVALAEVSLRVASGDIVGVAGLSGAGKYSLLRAMAGAAPAARGAVRLDGAALGDWHPAQLGGAIGYLPQDFVLYAGSIKENIARFGYAAGGDPETLDAQVIEAAQAIGAHDMILRLPNGYDTMVGPGEAGLSGGQMQRIAIARALFGNPRVLLLDEPSANLDADANAALIELIGKLRERHVTTLIATHDQTLLLAVDKIILLAGGRLAKYGPLREQTAAPARKRA